MKDLNAIINGYLFPTKNKFKCIKCLISALNVISYYDLWTSHLLTKLSDFRVQNLLLSNRNQQNFRNIRKGLFNALRDVHALTCVQRTNPKKPYK